MSNVINRAELAKIHTDLSNKAREIMAAKNHDYAHEGDVFRNFRWYGTLGVLVRLSDKLARLDSFEENKSFAVADEKLVDTVLDILNYAVIYYAMKQERDPKQPARVLEMPIPEIEGPRCFRCTQLADFREELPGRTVLVVYWCSNCAANLDKDTSEMTTLEAVI